MARRLAKPFVAVFTTDGASGPAARRRVEGLRQALLPEAGRGLPGATVRLRTVREGRALEIRIEADSLASLRAAVNSYLRWTALALEVGAAASAPDDDE